MEKNKKVKESPKRVSKTIQKEKNNKINPLKRSGIYL
jgi:hypothetical protein